VTRAVIVHSGNMLGGVESLLLALTRLTRSRGDLALEFALAFDGPFADLLRAEGAPVVIIGPARFRRPLEIRRMRQRLAAHLKATQADVVVPQSAWSHLALGPVIKDAGLPLVLWVHDVLDGRHWLQWMAARTKPDLLICNSQFTARAASTLFRRVPAVVVYAPLVVAPTDAADRRVIRQETNTPADAIVIVQVGRTDPLKGHPVLIDALKRLPGDGSWVCWQVGAPQNPQEEKYWRSIAERARAAGIDDRVRWLGQRSDVDRLLRAADIYCQPNIGPEAFGLTLAEALAAGLPVVTSRLGAAPEIVSEDVGVLVPAGDVDALADALGSLLTDSMRRHQLGMHGPERVRSLCHPEASLATLTSALDRLRALRAA
jgi:glycosyltransferase involved in cell wall biosynthesis